MPVIPAQSLASVTLGSDPSTSKGRKEGREGRREGGRERKKEKNVI
jgi:hypothetical protein